MIIVNSDIKDGYKLIDIYFPKVNISGNRYDRILSITLLPFIFSDKDFIAFCPDNSIHIFNQFLQKGMENFIYENFHKQRIEEGAQFYESSLSQLNCNINLFHKINEKNAFCNGVSSAKNKMNEWEIKYNKVQKSKVEYKRKYLDLCEESEKKLKIK